MADLLPTDVLLVNRAGVDHSIVQSDVMADVLDTDLLLVNRAGVDYNASYADVKKGFGPQHIKPAPSDWTFAPAIAGGTGTQADPFIITPETVSTPGGTVQSAQTLTLTGQKPNDLVEWTNHSVGTGDRFHQEMGLVPTGGQVDLRLKYLDTPNSTVGAAYTGDLQIGTSYFRWVVTQQVKVAPVIGAVTLADSPEAGRFTSGTFASAVTMTEDGLPVSTKGLKAWVEGTLKSAAQTSGIANVAGNVLTLTDSTQLANFAAGDAVTEVGGGGDATGTVGSVDATAKTITLSATAGTWDAGSAVKGPLKTQVITPKTSAITNVAGNVLTLTDDTSLANFRVGDVVQGNPLWNQSQVWSSHASANVPLSNLTTYANGFDGNHSVHVILQNTQNPGIVTLDFTGLGLSGDVEVYSNDTSISVDVNSSGSPVNLVVGTWTKFPNSGVVNTIKINCTRGVSVSEYFGAIKVGGKLLVDKGLPDPGGVKVTAIDKAAPSITVDGGSWSGTDATSSGTLANREAFVTGAPRPAANVKLYTIHNAAGAVSDLQSADPGYVIMAGNSPYTLTWPATMPTGNAPDVDLPAGTTLTTEIQATSAGSTAVTKASNIVTPT